MNFVNEDIITLNRVSITNLLQEIGPEEVRREIVTGLISGQKSISSKYFYNREGSRLFEEITALEEYYPTRTEAGILKGIAPDLMKKHQGYDIIELGSGDSSKISILFRAAAERQVEMLHYLPLDISQTAIRSSAEGITREFSNVQVEGYAVDFTSQFGLLRRERPVLICFFGSTIGNFNRGASLELLRNIGWQMKKGDVLLLGMDLVKPKEILHAAYNDAKGVTAAFNKNILKSVNELISSDFSTADFDHLAFFNPEKSRIEMHLVARRKLLIQSPYFKYQLSIERGESIHTENSHKYSRNHILEMASSAGLKLKQTHCDDRHWFALTEFQKA